MARDQTGPRDKREYVRIAVDLPSNPKLAALDDPAAGWAHVTAICYSGQHFTDGVFPVLTVIRIAGVPASIVDKLANAGLWHLPSHSCGVCRQPHAGHAVIHDYLEHQRSAADARRLREVRRRAGQAGASARWDAEANGKSHDTGHDTGMANSMAGAMTNGWQVDGKSMAEGEVEKEEEKKTSSTASRSTRSKADDPDFVKFWDVYPRKVGKGAARKAWAKVIKSGIDPSLIISGAERYRDDTQRKRKDIEYTKTPGPWLNDERWTDQLNGNDLSPAQTAWWEN